MAPPGLPAIARSIFSIGGKPVTVLALQTQAEDNAAEIIGALQFQWRNAATKIRYVDTEGIHMAIVVVKKTVWVMSSTCAPMRMRMVTWIPRWT